MTKAEKKMPQYRTSVKQRLVFRVAVSSAFAKLEVYLCTDFKRAHAEGRTL